MRSVGLTLARRFNAGERVAGCSRRVATADLPNISNCFQSSLRECFVDPIPGVEESVSKLVSEPGAVAMGSNNSRET